MAISINPRVRFRGVGKEGVAVNIETDEALVLNHTGLKILELLKVKPQSVSELAKGLVEEFQVDLDQAAIDVNFYVLNLEKHGIVVRG